MTEQPHPDRVRLLPWAVRPLVLDLAIIGVLATGMLVRPDSDLDADHPAEWVAAAAAVVAILVRRRQPLVVLAVGLAVAAVVVVITEEPTVMMPVVLVVLATVGLTQPTRVTVVAGLATTVIFAATVTFSIRQGAVDSAALASVAWPAFAAAAGVAVKAGRENLANAEERAQRAEASREIEAQRRVVEERLRIARDVHDLVAHHLAVVNVQSGVAGHVLRTNPEAAEVALGAVRESASTAVGELGQLLSVLRDPGTDEPVDPTPDLAVIDDLISSFAASGLVVENTTAGTPRPLGASTQAAAYRVIQEALTNAHKHGDGRVTLTRRFQPDALEIIVDNRHGAAPAPTSTGFGLVGMRERIEAAGGSLAIDAGADRFVVHARLPVLEPS